MSVNLTALLERVAVLEARDGGSPVTVEENCGPNGFPDYGENATNPDGLNTCVLVYSTVWFWLGVSCFFGPLLLTVALYPLVYFGIFDDDFGGLWNVLLCCFGPSTLLLGGYQRDYDFAGYVLVGLFLLYLVCLVLTTFQPAVPHFSGAVGGENVGGENEPAAVVLESGTERKAMSVYSNLDTPFFIVLVYGAAQSMLVGFYIYSLYTNGRPDFTNTDTYIFYFAGCLFQIILFSKHQYQDAHILSGARNHRLFKDGKPVKIGRLNILIRQILDLAINVCAAPVIYLSLPLQLAGTCTTYFDFLLNSCATVFILELDDKEGCTYILKSLAQDQESRATAANKVSDQESAAKRDERSASDSMASSSTWTPAPRVVLL